MIRVRGPARGAPARMLTADAARYRGSNVPSGIITLRTVRTDPRDNTMDSLHLRSPDIERRTRILAVAQREFLKEGFEGCSVDRIAAGAEVSKREVYRYFSSKTALFEAVARDIFGRASRTMAEASGAGKSHHAVLLRHARGILAAYSDETHLQLLRTAIVAGRHFPKLAAELQREVFGPPRLRNAHPGRLVGPQRLIASDPLSVIRLGSLAIDGSRFLLGTPLPSTRQRAEMAESAVGLYLSGYRSVRSRSLPFASRVGSTVSEPKPPWGTSLRMPQERMSTFLNVAMEEFLDRGYRAVNLDRLTRSAGISDATVYRHFGGKEGLFRYLVERRIFEISKAASWSFDAEDPEQAVAALARRTLDWHVRPDSIALQRLMIDVAPAFPDLARTLHDTLAGSTAGALQTVLQAQGLPPPSDMAARTFHGLATLGYWLLEICVTPSSAERQLISQETARIFLRGVAAAKRRRGARSGTRSTGKAAVLPRLK